MDKQEMIDKIYEVVADKTLSEGCIIQTRENSCDICSPGEYCGHKQYFRKGSMGYDETIFFDRGRIKLEDGISYGEWFGYRIIGHPVYIGNIISYIKTTTPNALEADLYRKGNKFVFEFENISVMELLSLRDDMNTTIDEQNEGCIRYVYDLITSTESK